LIFSRLEVSRVRENFHDENLFVISCAIYKFMMLNESSTVCSGVDTSFIYGAKLSRF